MTAPESGAVVVRSSFVRRAVTVAAVLVPMIACSFDSASWLTKRDGQTKEAERLRAAYSNTIQRVSSPSEGIAIPLETYPDGKVASQVSAAKAQFFDDATLIWAEGLKYVKLDAGGEEELRIEAASCLIDRLSRSGWIEGHAQVVQGKLVFEGDDVYFASSNGYVTAYANSDLKSEDLKFGALRPGEKAKPRSESEKEAPTSARVRARRTDLDHNSGVIMFEDDVFVEYSDEYTMNSGRLFAFAKGSNTLSRIVASGGVTVTNQSRVGECDMAVFRNVERKVEMYGGEKTPAKLVESDGSRSEVIGSKITFWIDTEQVEVVAPVISLEEKNVR